ncbi:MAG: hypothetical protein M3P48_07870, partial [Actinomycetota bacterium]|nr:hypothetical protein [Actinomycetota bacterium]
FSGVAAPYQLYRWLLPDYRADFWPLHVVWVGALLGLAWWAGRGVAAEAVGAAPYGVARGRARRS